MKQQEQSSEDTEALLALHKLYAEMANAVSQRRDNANKFFLTLATAPFALLVLASRGYHDVFSNQLVMAASGAIGIAVSIAWVLNLLTYKKLNEAKYRVITEIESELPHAGFTREWKLLEASNYPGLTKIEMILPIVVAVVYCALIGYTVATL